MQTWPACPRVATADSVSDRLSKNQKKRLRKKRSAAAKAKRADRDASPPKKKARAGIAKGSGEESALIGRDAEKLVWRHDADNKVHKADSKNTFITVGSATAALSALKEVYGEDLCPAALCSLRSGVMRLLVCDKHGESKIHAAAGSKAHRLPRLSGPNDTKNWAKVQRLTERCRKE
jgi:hypothetical protein